jgi:DNA-binding PadR family transcriptional regulator
VKDLPTSAQYLILGVLVDYPNSTVPMLDSILTNKGYPIPVSTLYWHLYKLQARYLITSTGEARNAPYTITQRGVDILERYTTALLGNSINSQEEPAQ